MNRSQEQMKRDLAKISMRKALLAAQEKGHVMAHVAEETNIPHNSIRQFIYSGHLGVKYHEPLQMWLKNNGLLQTEALSEALSFDAYCIGCKAPLPDHALYCCFCGKPVNITCPHCNVVSPPLPDTKFCRSCGGKLEGKKK
jgi:hypothetical protein